jgi:hypothetical protein
MIGTDVGQVGHALLFDQTALAGEHVHQARDDFEQQALQLIAAGRGRLLEDRFALRMPIHPVGDTQTGRCGRNV